MRSTMMPTITMAIEANNAKTFCQIESVVTGDEITGQVQGVVEISLRIGASA